MRGFFAAVASVAAAAVLASSCAPRLRVDAERMKGIETIAPVTFVANRYVQSPIRPGADPLPDDPTASTARDIFSIGVPAFVDAIRRTERFKVVDPETVLAAKAYAEFPQLVGVNAGAAQLADRFRLVEPDDGALIVELLEEIGADAALITYWSFSLDTNTRGVGVDTATPRARLRAWLVDRSGKVVADDEIEVTSDEVIGVFGSRYDAGTLTPMFADPIEVCAVRLVADLSNARAKGRDGS